MGLTQFEETTPLNQVSSFVAASGLDKQYFGGANPTNGRVDSLFGINTDSIDHVVDLWYSGSGDFFLIGSANIPAGSGIHGVPPVDILTAIYGPATVQIVEGPNDNFSLSMEVAVTGAFVVNVVNFGGLV